MGEWISISTKLPEEYDCYLATVIDGYVTEVTFVPYNSKGLIGGWILCDADGVKKLNDSDVVAWMPLPKPYRG